MAKSQENFNTALLELGFSEKEATVYVALLELGKSTVAKISQRAQINRTTGYDILSSLSAKGVVSISGKKPKQEYAAEPPEALIAFLEEKKRQYGEMIINARELVPKLKSIHNMGGRPQVRFYEGKDGLKHVYEDTLTSQSEIRAYANVDDMHNALPNYFPNYYKQRTKKGIKIRAIVPNTQTGKQRAERDKEELRETVLVPADTYYFTPEINIYDNKIMIASWREKLGIIIESEEIADAMKKIYELAWQKAQEFNRKERI